MMILIRRIFFCCIVLFFSTALLAQTDCETEREKQDVGIIGGGTFYMGDLTDNYSMFRHFSYYAGLIYRYNFTEYYAVRGQLAYGEIRGDMLRSDMPELRGNGDPWKFKRPMLFLEAAGEVGFMPLNVFDLRKNNCWAPFLAGGFGVVSLMKDNNLAIAENDGETFCGYLLIGFGVKYVIAPRITISAEWMMRKTFSDKIDYHVGIPGSVLINRDWIGTLGVTVTYRLKQNNPCSTYSTIVSDIKESKKPKIRK